MHDESLRVTMSLGCPLKRAQQQSSRNTSLVVNAKERHGGEDRLSASDKRPRIVSPQQKEAQKG